MANQALIIPDRQLSVTESAAVPALIESAGRKAKRRFVEFFTANINNDNTRAAYARAVAITASAVWLIFGDSPAELDAYIRINRTNT